MSRLMYLASDFPLTARPNPHEKTMSVNEALALGMQDIPDFMLEEGFDRDKPDVLLWSDREIHIDIAHNTIEDGDFDDDFSIWLAENPHGLPTDKGYCAFFDWTGYTPGRAEQLIGYLKGQLEKMPELEFWHIWMDDEPSHRVKAVQIPVSDLKPEDISELERQKVWEEPLTDYCYRITR